MTKEQLIKELAEKICDLTGFGGQLHPNDILPELRAAFDAGRASGIEEVNDKEANALQIIYGLRVKESSLIPEGELWIRKDTLTPPVKITK